MPADDLGPRHAAEQDGLCSDSTELVLCSYDSKQPQRVQATLTAVLSQVKCHWAGIDKDLLYVIEVSP